MDYIIFRKATNDFMCFSDGQIFITNDEEEIKEELALENADDKPEIFTLNYDTYYDSVGQEHTSVEVVDTYDNETIGYFTYTSHYDDEEDFTNAFNEWSDSYIGKKKPEMKYNLKLYIYLDGYNIEKWKATFVSLDEINKKLKEFEGKEDELIDKEIKRYTEENEVYIPEKIRKEECYLRYEIYPVCN